jgi:hypothetical protein
MVEARDVNPASENSNPLAVEIFTSNREPASLKRVSMNLPTQLSVLVAAGAFSYWLPAKVLRDETTPAEIPPEAAVAYQLPWDERLAENAAKATQGLQGNERSFANILQGVRAWAKQDAAAAWNFVKTLPSLGWRQKLAALLLESTEVAVPFAEEMWETLHPSQRTDFQASRLAQSYLDNSDFTAALARADKLSEGSLKAAFLKPVLATLAASDLAAAQAYVAKLPANFHVRDIQLQVALALGQKEPALATKWLEGLDEAAVQSGFSSIVAALANRDLSAAQAMLEAATKPPAAAIAALAKHLVPLGSSAAVEWAEKQASKLNPAGRLQVATALFSTWGSQEPTAAVTKALSDADAGLRAAKLAASSQAWALQPGGGAATLAHAAGLPAESAAALYRALLEGSGAGKTEELGQLRPTRVSAFDKLRELQLQTAEDAVHAGSLAAKWAEQEPQAALDWAKQLTGPEQATGLNSGLHLGMEAHYDTTIDWYLRQSPELRELGLPGAARGAARYHPEVAMEWLQVSQHVEAPALRQEIWNTWQATNPTEAQLWRNSHPLP